MPTGERVLRETMIDAGHYRWPAGKDMVRWQGSDDWHLVLGLSGQGLVGTGRSVHPAGKGRAVLWRPGIPQSYMVAPGCRSWERIWVHVKPPASWFDLLAWPELEPGLMAFDLPEAIRAPVVASLRDCIAHARAGQADGPRFACNRLEHALLLIARAVRAVKPRLDPRVDAVVAAVSADLASDWPVGALAARVGLSQAQVTRLCTRHLGESPHRLVERLRLQEASRRLAGAEAIAAVARAVGFSDVSHFTRRFRAQFQVTPGAWRDRQRAGVAAVKPDPEHTP